MFFGLASEFKRAEETEFHSLEFPIGWVMGIVTLVPPGTYKAFVI